MVNITDVKTCSLKMSPLSDDCHTFFFNSHTTCHDRMEKSVEVCSQLWLASLSALRQTDLEAWNHSDAQCAAAGRNMKLKELIKQKQALGVDTSISQVAFVFHS